MPKTLNDVTGFMEREWLAAFCTVDSQHEPQVVPVFFTYADGKVYVQADRQSVKVRNLLGHCSVAVAVYHGEEAVITRGTGRIVGDEEFAKRTWEHIYKYRLQVDEQGRDSLGIPLFDTKVRCIVEVTPRRLIFW